MVIGAGILWSLMGLSLRLLDTATIWQILLWRPVGMIPVVAWFIWWSSGRLIQPMRVAGLTGVVGGLGLAVSFIGAVTAIKSTTIANALFLFSAAPFFAAILGWTLLRERVRPVTWLAITVALLGVTLMVREGVNIGAMQGNIAAVFSALGMAVFTVSLRWGKQSDMLPAIVWGGAFSMIAAAAVLAAQGSPLTPPLHDLTIIITVGAVILGVGTALFTFGCRVVPAAEAVLLTLLEVILGPVWVWLLMGEGASAMTFVGGAVVLLAVLLNGLTGFWQPQRAGG